MIKQITICLLLTVWLITAPPAGAQQPGKIPTIGFMRGGSPTDPEVEAIPAGVTRTWVLARERTSSLSSEKRNERPIVFPALRRSWSV